MTSIAHRGLFLLVQRHLAAAVERSNRSADRLAAAIDEAEIDRADVVRLAALAEDAARLIADDDTIHMLGAVGRMKARLAAAKKAA